MLSAANWPLSVSRSVVAVLRNESRDDHRRCLNYPSAARRVAGNTMFLFAADVLNRLLMVLFYMVAARHLGVSEFGTLSFALAFVTMFALLTDLGLGAVTAREIARDSSVAEYYVSNSLAIKLVASLAVIVLVFAAAKVIGYEPQRLVVVMICCIFVFEAAFTSYFGAVFQGYERMHLTGIARLVQGLVLVAGVLLTGRTTATAQLYAWLYAVAGLVSVVTAAALVAKCRVRIRLRFRLAEWIRLLRTSAPLGLASILVTLYYWNGTAVLARLHGDRHVGLYSAPLRLVLALAAALVAFGGALYPLMSRLFVDDQRQLSKVLAFSLRIIVLTVVPVAVSGVQLARPIVKVLYGEDYIASVPVLRVLFGWFTCVGINAILGNYLVAADQEKGLTVQATISFGVNLLANFLLIPRYAEMGVAIAFALAELAGMVYLLERQRHTVCRISLFPVLRSLSGTTIAALLGAGAIRVLMSKSIVLASITGAVVTVAVLWATRSVTADDLRLFRSLLIKRVAA